MKRRDSYNLDAIDARIIAYLQVDGRQHNTEIARRLGVGEATVRKRIERLLRNGVMQIGAWTDPLKIGYQHYAIIQIQVNLVDIERVAKGLAKLPEVFFVGICTGAFDIYAAAVFRSIEHMHEFITNGLARLRGIQRTSTSSITRIVKRNYNFPVPGALKNPLGARKPGGIIPMAANAGRKKGA